MKKIFTVLLTFQFTLILLIPLCLIAQRKTLIWVYNQAGEKIDQGWVKDTTDSLLFLDDKKGHVYSLPVQNIGKIKTKNAEGIVVLTTIIGTAAGALLGHEVDDIDKSASQILQYDYHGALKTGSIVAGAFGGLMIGGIIAGASNKKFVINGDLNNWSDFQTYIRQRSNKGSIK